MSLLSICVTFIFWIIIFFPLTHSRGEVLAVDPLLLPLNAKGEIVDFSNICLLSMATVTKVIAISLRPSINVHFTQLLKVCIIKVFKFLFC
jgi:hypothetical protein